MKRQVYNPYLPLYEYIPDGEPHVFDSRVYVYGSHDQFGAFSFCHKDYVAYSAPLDDLTDWKYEGVILKKNEDPDNRNGKKNLFAPDVTCGPDKKYYIYYAYNFTGRIGVASSISPSGPFRFIGHVQYKDGTVLGSKMKDIFQFDPAVLTDEDGKVYLYSGFGPDHFFPQIRPGLKADGCYCMELDKDMLTIKAEPKKVLEKKGKADDEFRGHEFFEASSIRKINRLYYLAYSSIEGHELCYSVGKTPFGPFKYGGILISNGDVGLNGRTEKEACYPLGNNHGGLVNIKGRWYIFYHRHTNFTNTDRQGAAEEISLDSDGRFHQAEMTSCGLNGGPLIGKGTYPASICCCLKPKEGNIFYPFFKNFIQKHQKMYITQTGPDNYPVPTQYIRNVSSGSLIGYKYFDLSGTSSIALSLSGRAQGTIGISFNEGDKPEYIKRIDISSKSKADIKIPFKHQAVRSGLYISFSIKGKLNFFSFSLD